MDRRNIITVAGTTGIVAGLSSIAKAGGEKVNTTSKVADDELASLPRDIDHDIFVPLYEFILGIKAINNHMHYDSESDSIDWYINKLVDRNNVQSCGILNPLTRLLGVPPDTQFAAAAKLQALQGKRG